MNKVLKHINVSKLFVLLNYVALFTGLLNTYFRPKFFERYFSSSNFAFLLLIFGYAVYLTFLDGGVSKPFYAVLRAAFVKKGQADKKLLIQAFSFYNIVFLVALLLFFLLLLGVSLFVPTSLGMGILFLLALHLVLNFQLLNYKHVLQAVDAYEFYQKLEVLRRLINLGMLLSLLVDPSLLTGSAIANILLLVLVWKVHKQQGVSLNQLSFYKAVDCYRTYFPMAKNFFLFTVNETLIYNSGFILVPLFFGEREIIVFGLLLTVYNGVALFSRSIIDMSIHEITKSYLEGNTRKSKKVFSYSLLVSGVITLLMFTGIYLLASPIFSVWVGTEYLFSDAMFIGILIFLLGNVLQHVSGTFLLSVNNNYKTMKKMSFWILLGIAISQLLICWFQKSLEYFFVVTAVIYALGSFVYFVKAQQQYALNKT